jgi:hypothetical protein
MADTTSVGEGEEERRVTLLNRVAREHLVPRPPSFLRRTVAEALERWKDCDRNDRLPELPPDTTSEQLREALRRDPPMRTSPHSWLLALALATEDDGERILGHFAKRDEAEDEEKEASIVYVWKRCAARCMGMLRGTKEEWDAESMRTQFFEHVRSGEGGGNATSPLCRMVVAQHGVREDSVCLSWEAMVVALILEGDTNLRDCNGEALRERARQERVRAEERARKKHIETYERRVEDMKAAATTLIRYGALRSPQYASCIDFVGKKNASGLVTIVGLRTHDAECPVVDMLLCLNRCIVLVPHKTTTCADPVVEVLTSCGRSMALLDVCHDPLPERSDDASCDEDAVPAHLYQDVARTIVCHVETNHTQERCSMVVMVVSDGSTELCVGMDTVGVLTLLEMSSVQRYPNATVLMRRSGTRVVLDDVASCVPGRAATVALPMLPVLPVPPRSHSTIRTEEDGRGDGTTGSEDGGGDRTERTQSLLPSKRSRRGSRRTSAGVTTDSENNKRNLGGACEPCKVSLEDVEIVHPDLVATLPKYNFASRVGLVDHACVAYDPTSDRFDVHGNIAVYCDKSNGRCGNEGTNSKFDVKYRTRKEGAGRVAYTHGRFWDPRVANLVCNWVMTQPSEVRETNHAGRHFVDLLFPGVICRSRIGWWLRCTVDGHLFMGEDPNALRRMRVHWGVGNKSFEAYAMQVVRNKRDDYGDGVLGQVVTLLRPRSKKKTAPVRLQNPVDLERTLDHVTATRVVSELVRGGSTYADVESLPMPTWV